MDFHKLKLEKFSTYQGMNLPNDIIPPLLESVSPEVYFVYVTSIHDVMYFTNIIMNAQTHKQNRIIYIFKKGQTTFNRDHLFSVVSRFKDLKRKAPMLCSLNKTYSAFTYELEVK